MSWGPANPGPTTSATQSGVVLKKLLAVIALACACALAVSPRPSEGLPTGQCGIPDAQPTWIDFGDGSVPFWSTIFKRPGLNLAASNFIVPPQLRAAGARTVYFDLYLRNRLGTPSDPVAPEKVQDAADALFKRAAESSACDKPLIALNELFGASTVTPWSPTNAQYRANVLAFMQRLAVNGARPFLLMSSRPYTGGEAADWWRQASKVADLVPEVYFSGPSVFKQGPQLGSRRVRTTLRTRVSDLLAIGVPSSRIGLMLGFQSTPGAGGRERLEPATDWYRVVKWEALAAKEVAAELKVATIWSWGWGTWSAAGVDPDKETAACVYIWTRDHSLCDAPAKAGPQFEASLTEGQIDLPRGVVCRLGSAQLKANDVVDISHVTGDRDVAITALLQRTAESEEVEIPTADVLAAERSLIAFRFAGSRSAYLAALARAHATVAVARGVIADELRRGRVMAKLPIGTPSAAHIDAYYETYRDVPTRIVEATPAPTWLGRRKTGVALASVAPDQVFKLEDGKRQTMRTLEGTFTVRAVGDAVPLGELPLGVAQGAIRVALQEFARNDAYRAWTAKRQDSVLKRMDCAHDQLPTVAAIDLVDYLPFLAL